MRLPAHSRSLSADALLNAVPRAEPTTRGMTISRMRKMPKYTITAISDATSPNISGRAKHSPLGVQCNRLSYSHFKVSICALIFGLRSAAAPGSILSTVRIALR